MTTAKAVGELIYESAITCLYWDPPEKCLGIRSKGTGSSEQYRADLEKVLQVLLEKKARKLLANIMKMEQVSDEDLAWTALDWAARLADTSVIATAIVIPGSLGLHMALAKMAENEKTDTQKSGPQKQKTKFFFDERTAHEWLLQPE